MPLCGVLHIKGSVFLEINCNDLYKTKKIPVSNYLSNTSNWQGRPLDYRSALANQASIKHGIDASDALPPNVGYIGYFFIAAVSIATCSHSSYVAFSPVSGTKSSGVN